MSNYTQEQQEELEALLAGAALDALSPEDVARLDDYLKHDPELETEFCQFLDDSAALGMALNPIKPPTALRQRILKELSPNKPHQQHLNPWMRWQNWALAASWAIAGIVGAYNFSLKQELTLAQARLDNFGHQLASLEGKDTHLFALKGAPVAKLASGVVMVDTVSNRATIVLQNLQALDAGQSYHLWAVAGSKVIPCGEFKVNAVNRVVEAIPIPSQAYPKNTTVSLLVTLESSPNPVVPSAQIILETKSEIEI